MTRPSDNLHALSRRRGCEGAGALECRACTVICEVVVSPWRCLKNRQECIYAFADGEHTYFGCLHKVFTPEFDLEAFEGAEVAGERKGDPYGPVRVAASPRAKCPVSIERAYSVDSDGHSCMNPLFLREAFKVLPAGDGAGDY